MPQTLSLVTATAAAATAVTATAAATAHTEHVLYFVLVSVSGAASGPVTLTIDDGVTAVLVVDLSLAIGVPYQLTLPNTRFTNTAGNALSATVSAGATSCVVKLTLGYGSY